MISRRQLSGRNGLQETFWVERKLCLPPNMESFFCFVLFPSLRVPELCSSHQVLLLCAMSLGIHELSCNVFMTDAPACAIWRHASCCFEISHTEVLTVRPVVADACSVAVFVIVM